MTNVFRDGKIWRAAYCAAAGPWGFCKVGMQTERRTGVNIVTVANPFHLDTDPDPRICLS